MVGVLLMLVMVGASAAEVNQIGISADGRHFVFAGTTNRFTPWGFNYDRDDSGRLLEDYWTTEWKRVREDFQEMKAMGANVVRIHLQVGKFMDSATEPNRLALGQLGRLLTLAEETGLYLDLTGLGCYERKAVPKWFSELSESNRWEVQAGFWEAISQTCRRSPAVFCYDLMNEPVVAEDKEKRDWLTGELGGKCYVQRLTLDFAGRTAKEIAKAWVDKMAGAVRKHDQDHLVTLGAIPWALTWPGAKPLFYAPEASGPLDFVSVHFYPKKGEVDKALTALAVYDIGKPLVIEEMFPLSCSMAELDKFIDGSQKRACGWMGFYWGKTIAEYRASTQGISDALTLGWLEYFVKKTAEMGVKRQAMLHGGN